MDRTPEYLLALYVAERNHSPPIPPSYVADAVERSPSATTEMLQRLASKDLVAHEPYEGATLTAEGRERAADLYDRYRTLSRFFRDVLHLDAPEREALQLVGTVSTTVTDRLAATLLNDDDSADGSVDAPFVPVGTDPGRE